MTVSWCGVNGKSTGRVIEFPCVRDGRVGSNAVTAVLPETDDDVGVIDMVEVEQEIGGGGVESRES